MKKKPKRTPPLKFPTLCPTCGQKSLYEEQTVCVACDILGPDPDHQPADEFGPWMPEPGGGLVDLNEFRVRRGLPVYLGPVVDTPPHPYAGDAHLRDAHGNSLWFTRFDD